MELSVWSEGRKKMNKNQIISKITISVLKEMSRILMGVNGSVCEGVV